MAPVGPLRTRRVQLLAARRTCSPTDGCWREKQLTALGSERWREDTSPEKVWRLQDLARLIGESLSPYEASSERLGEAAVFTNAQIPAKNNEADEETGKCSPVIGSKYISGN